LTGPRPGASTDLHMLVWWRTRTDSVLAGPHFGADDGTLSGLHPKPWTHRERSLYARNAHCFSCLRESLNQVILLSVKTTSEVCEVEPVQQKCSEWGPERGDIAPNAGPEVVLDDTHPKMLIDRKLLTRPSIEICGRSWMRRFT
jgi:hypothetical protein